MSYGPEPPAPHEMTTRRGPPLAILPPAATVGAGGRPAPTPASGFKVAYRRIWDHDRGESGRESNRFRAP